MTVLPADVMLVGLEADLNFLDSQSAVLPAPVCALEAWRRVMARPLPGLALAFRVRDAVSARFGVARIGGFSGKPVEHVQVGDKLDFFLVEYVSDQILALTARDRRLDVMTCVNVKDRRVTITSSVRTHNWFGRFYMLPVAPAHRLIVWLMLRRLSRG